MNIKKTLVGIFALSAVSSYAQVDNGNLLGGDVNTITTAVPFLSISPDSRAGAMGDVGAATSPDVNSMAWNPAKLAFIENEGGVALSYVPWLRQLTKDINLSYLTGYKRLDENSAIAGSLRYFTLGDIQFTDEFGNNTIQHRPNEFSLDAGYARKLSKKFSGSVTLRYVYSNLTGGQNVGGADTKPGQAVAGDVFFYYQNDKAKLGDKDATFAFGVGISNIGTKMAYSNLNEKDFLPMNFKMGPRLTLHLDDYNDITFTADINKLLVPTPPIYMTKDENGNDISGQNRIGAGEDPDRSVGNVIFTSWADAPGVPIEDPSSPTGYVMENGMYVVEKGSVFREEMREFYGGLGVEYTYDQLFSARLGYFAEHETKGNRKYMTFGFGVNYNMFILDFSYLIPAYFGNQQYIGQSPLENTLRFTLGWNFGADGATGNRGGGATM